MTFLNPFILIGLAAAAIPVILHLISLRKLRTVEFSSLAFLKELQRTKIRRLKLRQLLLLFLRTLLILLVVLAFARPTLRDGFLEGIGSKARTTAVILVDDSFSMSAADENGDYFKQAREAAGDILEFLGDDDDVHLFPLSAARMEADRVRAPGTAEAARSLLSTISPTPLHRPLEDGVRFAAAVLSESKNLIKEIYVISDLQEGLVSIRDDGAEEDLFPPEVRVFLVPIGHRNLRNLAVESMAIPNSILEVDRPFSLEVTVVNHSDQAVENTILSVFLNGTRVAQRGVSLESSGRTTTAFSVTPRSSGFQEVTAEFEGDDLESDNRRFMALYLPKQTRVLIVGDASTARYVTLALEARRETGSTLAQSVIPPEQLSTDLLAQADVVVVTNPAGLSAFQADRLNGFLLDGGGIAVFPDPRGATSASLFRALNAPPITSVESPGQSPQASFVGFDRSETSHPLFEGMFAELEPGSGQREQTLESPRINRYARFIPSERSAPIITLSNGSPFLLEQQSGDGRILIFAVAPTIEWSDFPLKGLFVPLIHRSVSYLSQEQTKQPSIVAGESVQFTALQGQKEQLSILTPGNLEGDLKPLPGAGIRFKETDELGIYAIKSRAGVLKTFSVNMDPNESRTAKASGESLEALLVRIGIPAESVSIIPEREAVQAAVMETRYGVELWKHFLVAALLVAIIEMLIARTGQREGEQNSD